MWDLTTTKQYRSLRKKLLLFCFPSRGFPSRGSPPQPMWDITIHPFQGPAFSRTLVPFSKRCRIRTKSTPLRGLAFLLVHHLMSTPLQGPMFSPVLVPFSKRCGIPTKSTPFRALHPYWHTASCLPPLGNISQSTPFRA